MGGAGAVGAMTGVACLVFLAAEHLITDALWGEDSTPTGFFTGSWIVVGILIAASVMVGLIRHRSGLGGDDPNFLGEMVEGEVPLKRGLRFGALGLVSLVGGASVGPEAPLGTLGGSIGTAVGQRYERSEEATEDLTFAGISGVFGALSTFPFAGPIMAMEVYEDRWHNTPARMLPGVVSATTALAVLYPAIGTPFLSIYDLGEPELKISWIPLAILLGILGAALGLISVLALALSGSASQRVGNPIVRALIAGVVIAAIGFTMPLTLFSGRDQLTSILAGGADITAWLLVALLFGKLVAFVFSMRWGFFGGPIFPLIFLGAVAGTLLHMAIPSVPLVVAVPALAGAVAVTSVPLPLMIMVLTTIMFGLRLELAVIPAVAIVTSLVLVRGTGIVVRLQKFAGTSS